jgi:hypothetical protein
MNSSSRIPFFVFAYVSRKPKSLDEGIKLPVVRRQLLRIKACAAASGWILGRRFMMATTYRSRAFIDYPVFDEAVRFAHENGTALLVADLAELLGSVPIEKFLNCVERLEGLEIDLWDAATGRRWHDFGPATRNAIHGMAIERHRRAKRISLGRDQGKKPDGNIARNQAAGARANKVRSLRAAEQIRPIVDEMEAELPTSEELSPSALMHRLNELGIKGPRSDRWSLNAAKRYLQILADRRTTASE